MEPLGEIADFIRQFTDMTPDRADPSADGVRRGGKVPTQCIKVQTDGSEALVHIVVEIARDATPLLILYCQELAGQRAKIFPLAVACLLGCSSRLP